MLQEQELVSAQVHHGCREIPWRLRARPQRHAWPLELQPFIPTRPPTHLDRFQNSPVLPARLSCERTRPSWQLSPPQRQRPALPWAPRRARPPLTTHNRQAIKAEPHRETTKATSHRGEAKLTWHNTAAVLAPVPVSGPFWLSPFVKGPEEEEQKVTQQPCVPGATGDLQLSSMGQLCPGLEERRGALTSLQGALPALPSQQSGGKKPTLSGKTESGRNS